MVRRKSILAVLVYVFSASDQAGASDEVLLIHRDTRDPSKDEHSGKWNGLGGKLNVDESLLQAAVRELQEESGFVISEKRFGFLGFIQFPNFKPRKHEDWNVGVFYVNATKEERAQKLADCEEGTLHWVPVTKIPELPFWPGDEAFLPKVLKKEPFYGVIRYKNGNYFSASICPVG